MMFNIRQVQKKFFFTFLFILCFIVGTVLTLYIQSNIKEKKVAIVYIATGRYILFWDKFYENSEKFFLPDYKKQYFVITDNTENMFLKNALKIYQKQLPWPGIVLNKYHFIDSLKNKLKDFKYIYAFNANLIPIKEIGKEILPTADQRLVVLEHSGFFNTNKLPYDRNPNSTAYIPNDEGKYYFSGAFVGGFTKDFLELTTAIKYNIDADNKNGQVARWHDESHLNRCMINWIYKGNTPKILTPLYMMPEEAINSNQYKNIKEFKEDAKMILLDKSKKGHYWWRSVQE